MDGQRLTSSREPRVTVVLPAHDERPTIADVVERCARHTPGLDEVLVIDDGSTDGTAAAARAAGARVVRLDANRGKGVALRRGIAEAAGDVVVFLDADGQDAPEEIPSLLAALEPDVAMVIGSRFLGRFDRGAITALNRAGTRFLTGVLNALFRTAVTDPIAGFRAARLPALRRCTLTAERYDIEVDVLLALLGRGERVVEVPVGRAPRAHGRTGLSPVWDGSRILWRILTRRIDRARVA